MAYFLQQGRKSEEQTEFLLAQLEDAREQQLQAAAIAERARIASELHDVLAHSLSGAPIQLQGAPVRLPASTLLTPARGNANAVGRSYR